MITVKRYRPSFFSGYETPDDIKIVSDMDELLNIEWIKQWNDITSFYKYSIDDNLILVESFKGYSWNVIARVDNKEFINLTKPLYKELKCPSCNNRARIYSVLHRTYKIVIECQDCGLKIKTKDNAKYDKIDIQEHINKTYNKRTTK